VRGAQPVGSHEVRHHDWHSVPLSANGEASTHPWRVQGRVREGCAEPAQPSPATGRRGPLTESGDPASRPLACAGRTQRRRPWFPRQSALARPDGRERWPYGRARPRGWTTDVRPAQVDHRPRGRNGHIVLGTLASLSRWQRFSNEARHTIVEVHDLRGREDPWTRTGRLEREREDPLRSPGRASGETDPGPDIHAPAPTRGAALGLERFTHERNEESSLHRRLLDVGHGGVRARHGLR
jgi:hypothetical protein